MSLDFIRINRVDTAATHSFLLIEYISTLRDAYSRGQRIRGIMNHNQDGVTFTNIETLFGLPPGQGQAVYNLVNGSVGAMEGTFQVSDAKDITERVG